MKNDEMNVFELRPRKDMLQHKKTRILVKQKRYTAGARLCRGHNTSE